MAIASLDKLRKYCWRLQSLVVQLFQTAIAWRWDSGDRLTHPLLELRNRLMELSQSLVVSILESSEIFSVDFDDAWQWIGYTRKDSAKERLTRNFQEGVDFTLRQMAETKPDGSYSHRRIEIKLTVDCFKSLAMMAGTPKGREVRHYFLRCESELKNRIAGDRPQIPGQLLFYERMKLFMKHTDIPDGYWCIFQEITGLMGKLEVRGFVFPDRAVPDVSVGKCWSAYLKLKGDRPSHQYYPHIYPDHRGEQPARIYPVRLLSEFREWLHATYIPNKFPGYVRQICSAEECELIAAIVGHPVLPKGVKRLKASAGQMRLL